MANTTNLSLPEITHGEVNGDVTHNTGLWITDVHGQAIAEDRTATPPVSPTTGQAWIIAPSATGIWTGLDNQVAHYYNGAWYYYTPRQGWRFYNKADALIWLYNGLTWEIYIAGDLPQPAYGEAFFNFTAGGNTQSLSSGTRVLLDGFESTEQIKNTVFTLTPGAGSYNTLTFSNSAGYDGVYQFLFSAACDFTGNGTLTFWVSDQADILPDILIGLIDVSNNQISAGNSSSGILYQGLSTNTYGIEVEADTAGTVTWYSLVCSILRVDT